MTQEHRADCEGRQATTGVGIVFNKLNLKRASGIQSIVKTSDLTIRANKMRQKPSGLEGSTNRQNWMSPALGMRGACATRGRSTGDSKPATS